jgi:ornithine cyclodeaminase
MSERTNSVPRDAGTLRVLTKADVERLLPMSECIEAVDAALRALARGDAVLPLRPIVALPDRSGLLGAMPAYLGEPRVLGLKAVSVFPGNHGTPLDSHQGVILLFDVENGAPLAAIDAASVTAIRTAAASAVATRALARPDAGDLAILGSGVQSRTHLEAMRAVRPVRRVRVWSRSTENARRFAALESARGGVAIEVVASAHDAVEGADLVCTTTGSREPILRGEWLAAGTHVNAVGSCFPDTRELDAAAVARARLFVDREESARNEAGDFLLAVRDGAIGDDHIVGELGDVLLGRLPGRRTGDEITLFESLGIAVEDLAAAHLVLRKAVRDGVGFAVDFASRGGAASPIAT